MQKQVLNQITKLGGRFVKPRTESLKGYIQAIRFPHVLYNLDWDVYGIDDFLADNRSTFDKSESKFFDELEKHYFTNSETPRGQTFWRTNPFTPLTPGTEDHDEWGSYFDNPEYVDLAPLREIFGEGTLEFMQIIYDYGYPDHFYVCLQDPKPKNPTVFGTDHEEFFREYSMPGTLSDFLEGFLTKKEFRKIVKEYLDDT